MNAFSIKNMLQWSYWFQQPYTAEGSAFWVAVIIFLALILVGLLALFVSRVAQDAVGKNVLSRVSPFGLTIGMFGLLWLFFRQERVAFLAWRFWLVLLFAVAVVWIYKIIHFIVKRVPVIRREKAERNIHDRYAPGKR